MQRGRNLMIGVAFLVLGIGGWFALGPSGADVDGRGAPDASTEMATAGSENEAGRATGDADEAAPSDPRRRAADPEVRALAEELRRQIREARRVREAEERQNEGRGGQRPTKTGGPAADETETPQGSMDPQYIRDAVAAIVPLIRECYELALSEDESLAGRLVVEFDIEGEPDAGGIVEGTEIDEESTLSQPTLDECVTETLYTLELPSPEGGGMVHVRYPFVFSNAPEGEGQ